jgi:Insulinase (Peptidase family M16)
MCHTLRNLLLLAMWVLRSSADLVYLLSLRSSMLQHMYHHLQCLLQYTELEYTLYHFDIMPAHLEAGLDRFAQFFIAPLMNEGSTARELNSIESEFCLSKNSDSCRLQELWCATSAPEGHPFGNFTWGSKYFTFLYLCYELCCTLS